MLFREDEGKFALLIRKVQPKDEGTYECQISTKPTRSIFVVLRIKSEWNENRNRQPLDLSEFKGSVNLSACLFVQLLELKAELGPVCVV